MAAVCLVLVVDAVACSPAARAQSAPLTEVDDRTEVRLIGFRFPETQTFATGRLKEHIWHSERGRFAAARRVFGWLPFVTPLGVHRFSPVELARDEVRLERFFARHGFLFADVNWLVRLDTTDNVVTILFSVAEGPPLLLEAIDYRGPDGRPAREHLSPELRDEWEAFKRRVDLQTGERHDQMRLIELEEQALSWVRDRGYPFAEVGSTEAVDSLANRASVTVHVDPGPRARIGSIEVVGNETVRDRVVLRELPFTSGDLFSQRRLIDGQREVFGLRIFGIALVDVPPQPRDSIVDIRVRVRERDPHAVSAQVGYLTEAGLTGQAEWMHRNFLGDARTFTASALANTGLGSFVTDPDRRYRLGLSVHQPYVFHRRVSATGSAFAEWRDDFRDLSRAFGGDATLLYEWGAVRSISASYEFEDRRVREFRFGGGTRDPDVMSLIDEFLDIATAVSPNLSRSAISLRGTWGDLDNPLNPRRGYVLRPALQTTVPFPATELEYQRVRLAASAYLPLGDRITFAGRASAGRLFPGGPPPQDEGEAFLELLRLRDVVFLAGGTVDVRGWAPGLLGPKVIDILVHTDEEEPTLSARRYFPYGGTMRLTGTAEARYQFTDTFGTFAFADAGRVSTPQPAYQLPEDSPFFDSAYGDTDRIFVGVGGGLSLASPVGAIQVALGYKVNPSFFDVRNPDDIAQAFEAVLRADPDAGPEALREAALGVDPSPWRRIRLHLSIGQVF